YPGQSPAYKPLTPDDIRVGQVVAVSQATSPGSTEAIEYTGRVRYVGNRAFSIESKGSKLFYRTDVPGQPVKIRLLKDAPDVPWSEYQDLHRRTKALDLEHANCRLENEVKAEALREFGNDCSHWVADSTTAQDVKRWADVRADELDPPTPTPPTGSDDALREHLEWMVQTIHQAYHQTYDEGCAWQDCRKDVCASTRRALDGEEDNR
ncbi:MAG: hypothetical protein ACRDQA_01945, partial [Nocardioidaceae bacterium]